MILNNFKRLMFGGGCKSISGENAKSSINSLSQLLQNNTDKITSSFTGSYNVAAVYRPILSIGKNDAEVTPDDYVLDLFDETNFNIISQTIDIDKINNPREYMYKIMRVINYSTSATESLTVNEIGLYLLEISYNSGFSISHGINGGSHNRPENIVLIAREKLETPVILNPGSTHLFTMEIRA